MSIIYEQTPNGLYPTGQRTVSTFPSGLIRVDQTFACKTSAAATHRATLAVGANFPGDSYPAMDGLKIFPEPQERRRDDGFTEFTVSAFGRVNDFGTSIYSFDFSPVGLTTQKRTKTSLRNYVALNSDQNQTINFPNSEPLVSVAREITNTTEDLLYKYNDWVGYLHSTNTVSVAASGFRLSFYGSGTVILSGQHSSTIQGLSNQVKKVYDFTVESAGDLTIQPSGTVRSASLVYFGENDDVLGWVDLIGRKWALKSISSNNFGFFKEVSVLFSSI